MTTDIKRDIKWVAIVSAIILGYGFCGDAKAQLVQPTYIRPSKGAKVVTITGKTIPAVAGAGSCPTASPPSCLSAVYDMTAFDAVQIYIQKTSDQTVLEGPWLVQNLPPFIKIGLDTQWAPLVNSPTVTVYGASAATTPFTALSGAFAVHDLNFINATVDVIIVPIPISSQVASVGALPQDALLSKSLVDSPPVIVGGVYATAGAVPVVKNIGVDGSTVGSAMNVFLTGVPAGTTFVVQQADTVPFLPATTPIAVAASPAAATLIYTTVGSVKNATLQNVGVWPAACAVGTNAASVSLTRYNFTLAPGSTVGDGTGGSYAAQNLPAGTQVYCIGNGGAASVALMPQ